MGTTSKVGASWIGWAAGFIAASIASVAFAQSVNVSVPGTSNPYLAGMPNGSACCSGDAAPAQSPVQVTGIPVTPGSTITFSATGGVDFSGGAPSSGPDGAGFFGTPANNGISGATWTANSLVGVFLDNNQPDLSSAPGALDFSSGADIAFGTLAPALRQAFFIGDGRTGTGSGSVQSFIVPAGATRLYLGVSDGFGWFNNSGAFSVTVSAGAAAAPTGTAVIPTLSLPALALLALALAAAVPFLMRRD